MARHLIKGDLEIRNVKRGTGLLRLSDGDGLFLQLFVNGGSHGWRLAYSHQGRRNILSLGRYPDTGLALARRRPTNFGSSWPKALTQVRNVAKPERLRQTPALPGRDQL